MLTQFYFYLSFHSFLPKSFWEEKFSWTDCIGPSIIFGSNVLCAPILFINDFFKSIYILEPKRKGNLNIFISKFLIFPFQPYFWFYINFLDLNFDGTTFCSLPKLIPACWIWFCFLFAVVICLKLLCFCQKSSILTIITFPPEESIPWGNNFLCNRESNTSNYRTK